MKGDQDRRREVQLFLLGLQQLAEDAGMRFFQRFDDVVGLDPCLAVAGTREQMWRFTLALGARPGFLEIIDDAPVEVQSGSHEWVWYWPFLRPARLLGA